ncbi:MAG: signal peptide peptidase SppA [Saprospiraceae bacterium]|nr:signal peptide peptidase SppA [Saprospiraceae bacterium]
MRQFFKFVFASCLGVILASFVVTAIMFAVFGAISSAVSTDDTADVKPNTVLAIDFTQAIPEKTNNLPVNPFDFQNNKILGLQEILDLIKKASEDDDIKAIYLNLSGMTGNQVTSRKIRQALADFKASGKKVIAYSHYYPQATYYLASVADQIYVNPIGAVEFQGYGVILAFFKDMLDKLGIEMQVFYAGQFKSATEPFRMNEMSDQNRLQIKEYMEDLYDIFLDDVAASRGITKDSLKAIAEGYLSRDAESSKALGLIDDIKYEDEVRSELKAIVGIEENDDLNSISLQEYAKGPAKTGEYGKGDKIAVVYAEGEINDGIETAGQINGDNYVKILRKIREDDKVKALVLRVNSGGGSVLASDRILREIQLIKDKGIPVVTSMGDVAASGGYYIACNSNKIFAEPNTITGSIGVFGILPSVQKLFNDKLGIHFDTVQTQKYSTAFTPFFKLKDSEFAILQNSVDKTYDRFLTLVAKGRSMTKEEVHAVAQGRVWSGRKAKEIGLVDELGGLEQAIAAAAALAELKDYRTTDYPRIKDPMQQFIEQITGADDGEAIRQTMMKRELGDMYGFYTCVKQMKDMKGPQARLPFMLYAE